jgi:hypothetical protein
MHKCGGGDRRCLRRQCWRLLRWVVQLAIRLM